MTACDLNVPSGNIDSISDVLSALFKSGYQKVALNHTVAKLNKTETANFNTTVEQARKLFEKKDTPGRIKAKDDTRQIYSRLTITLSGAKDDAGQIFSSSNPLLQSYDILAVAPSDFKTFQAACALDVDIIVVPHASYTSYMRHATVKTAQDRGVHFEISIGPYLRNPELRSNLFACGSAVAASTGGKNILLTNGAEKGMEVRGVNDLANLATLIGIDFGLAKHALSSAPASILLRSAARKSAKGVLRVTSLPSAAGATPKKGDLEAAAKNEETDATTSQKGDFSMATPPPSKKGKITPTPGALPEFIPFDDETKEEEKGKGKGKGKTPQKANEGKQKGKRKAGAQ
eukprot:Phypoly_transcript_13135.p1 GENE.Phypoly_transcript_13135~~Phypoly_transcript_13135.p1  ORF type:complete len:346 (+),score=90.63 Phypoly_transcript_13135:43-1080(+)